MGLEQSYMVGAWDQQGKLENCLGLPWWLSCPVTALYGRCKSAMCTWGLTFVIEFWERASEYLLKVLFLLVLDASTCSVFDDESQNCVVVNATPSPTKPEWRHDR